VYDTFKDSVTIYREDDVKVNINTASSNVLMAVVGDPVLVQAIVDYRNNDGIFTNASDISMIQGLDPAMFSWQSNIFRIWASAVLADDADATKTAEAIVDRTSGKIHHWRED